MSLRLGNVALPQGNGHGKGHGKHGDDDEGESCYRDNSREVRGWYESQENHLPPGLADNDQPPPGLRNSLQSAARCP
jgi:hypothetical protein